MDTLLPSTPDATEARISDLMHPMHSNGMRRASVFGGVIMSMIDKCAAISALRHARCPVTTLSVDRILFKEPIHVGELVEVESRVQWTGRTSMAIWVNVWATNLETGGRRHTNECWATFVALGDDGRPVPVPPIRPMTEEDRALYEVARRRREEMDRERKR